MLNASHLQRPTRLMAALVGLCYFFLSAVLPFQHHHGPGEAAEAFLRYSVVSSDPQAPPHTQLKAVAKTAKKVHCAACEWQAVNVSPALPVFAFRMVSVAPTRVITTFPRYLHLRAFPTPSRAPPAV